MFGVDAALIAEATGLRVRIDGRGNVLTCNLDGNPITFISALRRGGTIVKMMRAAIPILIRLGLRVDLVAGGIPVGRLGTGVEQNALARVLQLPSTHLGK